MIAVRCTIGAYVLCIYHVNKQVAYLNNPDVVSAHCSGKLMLLFKSKLLVGAGRLHHTAEVVYVPGAS